jgi:hypothetical protein
MTPGLWKALLRFLALAVAGALVVAQLVPYGRDHSGRPIVAEPVWIHPATRELARRACFDCHSNETRWPWYAQVAPISWWMAREVEQGRRAVNFSEWGAEATAHRAGDTVLDGSMPPRSYLVGHPEARLTGAERDELALGLDVSLAAR